MKQDIAIVTDPKTGGRDIAIGNDGDLLSVSGFETSIDCSILTNRRASQSDVVKPEYRRGWIGDIVSKTDRLVGSTLWIYEQKRLTQEIVASIEDSARKGLQWLVDTGSALSLSVAAEKVGPYSLRLEANIRVGNSIITRYYTLWFRTGGI